METGKLKEKHSYTYKVFADLGICPLQLFLTVSVDNGPHIQWRSCRIIIRPNYSSPIKCLVEEVEEIKIEEKNIKNIYSKRSD